MGNASEVVAYTRDLLKYSLGSGMDIGHSKAIWETIRDVTKLKQLVEHNRHSGMTKQ